MTALYKNRALQNLISLVTLGDMTKQTLLHYCLVISIR
jgi:hypothetical protein